MLNLTEHEISTAHKAKMLERLRLAFKRSDGVFIMLINVKVPTIVGILTIMSIINVLFSWAEHEKESFIALGPEEVQL